MTSGLPLLSCSGLKEDRTRDLLEVRRSLFREALVLEFLALARFDKLRAAEAQC
jgi:hypothetical protein